MRLIDADELLKNYTNSFVSAYGVECAEMFQGVINQSKTAFDIDKVVQELEEIAERHGGEDYYVEYGDAEDIVKRGGLNENCL